jgi:hypothetical protein
MMFRELALAEVCEMNSGGTPRREFTKYYGGDIKWAKISDIENAEGGYLFQTEETITEEGLRSINNRIFPVGDVWLGWQNRHYCRENGYKSGDPWNTPKKWNGRFALFEILVGLCQTEIDA